MGSTTVRYLTQLMLPRPYTLECTQVPLLSDIVCVFLFCSTIVIAIMQYFLQKSKTMCGIV